MISRTNYAAHRVNAGCAPGETLQLPTIPQVVQAGPAPFRQLVAIDLSLNMPASARQPLADQAQQAHCGDRVAHTKCDSNTLGIRIGGVSQEREDLLFRPTHGELSARLHVMIPG